MPALPLNHGAIGDRGVLRLVGPDTGIDWLCVPRFDSPSVFARLLDKKTGRHFQVGQALWASASLSPRTSPPWRTLSSLVSVSGIAYAGSRLR